MAKDRSRHPPHDFGQPAADDREYIYRPWITTKDGRRIYAKDRGLAAFKILKRY